MISLCLRWVSPRPSSRPCKPMYATRTPTIARARSSKATALPCKCRPFPRAPLAMQEGMEGQRCNVLRGRLHRMRKGRIASPAGRLRCAPRGPTSTFGPCPIPACSRRSSRSRKPALSNWSNRTQHGWTASFRRGQRRDAGRYRCRRTTAWMAGWYRRNPRRASTGPFATAQSRTQMAWVDARTPSTTPAAIMSTHASCSMPKRRNAVECCLRR